MSARKDDKVEVFLAPSDQKQPTTGTPDGGRGAAGATDLGSSSSTSESVVRGLSTMKRHQAGMAFACCVFFCSLGTDDSVLVRSEIGLHYAYEVPWSVEALESDMKIALVAVGSAIDDAPQCAYCIALSALGKLSETKERLAFSKAQHAHDLGDAIATAHKIAPKCLYLIKDANMLASGFFSVLASGIVILTSEHVPALTKPTPFALVSRGHIDIIRASPPSSYSDLARLLDTKPRLMKECTLNVSGANLRFTVLADITIC